MQTLEELVTNVAKAHIPAKCAKYARGLEGL